ncbi:MAG: response regulator [Planctomycetota bacterium]|nr:MAG: response regulator [Planctomycetota bacterium]
MKSIFLLPGESAFCKEPAQISTLLGSCVALVLHDPQRAWGGMNHFMLPDARDGSGLAPGKYGDKAIANLLKVASMSGCKIDTLRGRLYGGARVVGHLASAGSMDIGQRNIDCAEKLCREAGLRIVQREIGGSNGRKIFFDVTSGVVEVRMIQQSAQNQEAAQRRERLTGRRLRVLVVDDSATVRRLIAAGINASNDMEVCAEAENPYEAREQLLATDPDVLCLDVIMPRMDGLTFLRKIMQYKPIPTVVVSTIAKQGSAMHTKLMQAGAVAVIDKETLNLYRTADVMERVLLPKLRQAAHSVVQQRSAD